ncbi:MAG: GntR family transcriptional regulator [Pseudomonadota bacterium]
MADSSALKTLGPLKIQSIADTVFDELHQQILSLELPPGTKVSEAEVAKHLGVSRQPVRDAFYRLSQLGLLLIRPQRATVISKISKASVLKAKFIRTALEIACWKLVLKVISDSQISDLEDMLHQQQASIAANNQQLFHQLDDDFHRLICEIAGQDYVWALIREQKAHMDRVRFISLAVGSAQKAYEDHIMLVDAVRARDAARVETVLTEHLGRVEKALEQIRTEKPEYFEE